MGRFEGDPLRAKLKAGRIGITMAGFEKDCTREKLKACRFSTTVVRFEVNSTNEKSKAHMALFGMVYINSIN